MKITKSTLIKLSVLAGLVVTLCLILQARGDFHLMVAWVRFQWLCLTDPEFAAAIQKLKMIGEALGGTTYK